MELQFSARVLIHAAAKSATLGLNECLTVSFLHGISFAMPARALFGEAKKW